QLREFRLSPQTGRLVPSPLELTPALAFNGSEALARFINANQAAIIAERHTLPDSFEGAPFRAGAIINDLDTWFTAGVDPQARHHFAINTCNGCHSGETGTGFLQIGARMPGREAGLSRFLTGVTIGDPVTGELRTLNDLGRRATDLRSIVCAPPA